MAAPWVSQVHPIKDGENVQASVANRMQYELQQRTDYLKSRLDALDAGQVLMARGVPVYYNVDDPASVLVGHAVYWDPTTGLYKAALARVVYDPVLGGFVTAPSSYVMGICVFKYGNGTADIALNGLVDSMDFTQAIGTSGTTAAEAGAYYLSASIPGHYTKSSPPFGIYVCYLRGDGSAHVQPTPHEILEAHIHYAIDLVAQPAGELACPDPASNYAFVSADPSQPGWLPADSAIFGGFAPADAIYGYNLSADSKVNRIWPPFPPESVYLEKNGIGVDSAHFRADSNGLWWLQNSYGNGPWPIEPRPCSGGYPEGSSSIPDPVGPTLEQMGFIRTDPEVCHMRLYLTKLISKENAAVVASLSPAVGSPITVVGCDGKPASRGNLQLGLNLSGNVTPGDTSMQALKSINGFQFTQGYVVTGLQAGANVQIMAKPGTGALVNGMLRGELSISASTTSASEGGTDLVALNGVREDSLSNVFYLAFPQGRQTAVRARINLPNSGVPGPTPWLRLWCWMMSLTSGIVLPPLSITYRVLKRPNPMTPYDRLALPPADSSLTIGFDPTNWGAVSLNNYLELNSDPFPVAAGAEILATIQRPVDTYAGDVALLRLGFLVYNLTA